MNGFEACHVHIAIVLAFMAKFQTLMLDDRDGNIKTNQRHLTSPLVYEWIASTFVSVFVSDY